MKRIYHSMDQWEELHFNMWGSSLDQRCDLRRALYFTANHRLFGRYMRRVVTEWPISCENALSDLSMNRNAWLGQAATALALRIPEDITRSAWAQLTTEQQNKANTEARNAIKQWEYAQAGREIHRDVGSQMLLGWVA